MSESQSIKWLVLGGVLIMLIAIIAISLTIINDKNDTVSMPDDSPEATVQRYLTTIMADNYSEAHALLNNELKDSCSKQDMRRAGHWSRNSDALITLVTSDIREDSNQARVTINISEFSDPSPFGGTNNMVQTYHLIKTDAGWRFSEYPWPIEFCESSGAQLSEPMTDWVLRG